MRAKLYLGHQGYQQAIFYFLFRSSLENLINRKLAQFVMPQLFNLFENL